MLVLNKTGFCREKLLSFPTEFGRKYSEMEDLGPGSQDSSPVDLKVCDCFQALNMAISTIYRRPSIKRHIGSFLTLEGVKTAERWKTSYHFL